MGVCECVNQVAYMAHTHTAKEEVPYALPVNHTMIIPERSLGSSINTSSSAWLQRQQSNSHKIRSTDTINCPTSTRSFQLYQDTFRKKTNKHVWQNQSVMRRLEALSGGNNKSRQTSQGLLSSVYSCRLICRNTTHWLLAAGCLTLKRRLNSIYLKRALTYSWRNAIENAEWEARRQTLLARLALSPLPLAFLSKTWTALISFTVNR